MKEISDGKRKRIFSSETGFNFSPISVGKDWLYCALVAGYTDTHFDIDFLITRMHLVAKFELLKENNYESKNSSAG